jgi:hypothetical protein
VPGIVSPPTFYPAFTVGGYSSLGPLAGQISTATLNSDYGFGSVVVVFPSTAGGGAGAGAGTYPAMVWSIGAFTDCNSVDNMNTMEHLASWGIIVFCPEVASTPYRGAAGL